MRHLLLILLTIAGLSPAMADTSYYRLEKIVTDGVPAPASGSGLFITFTNSGCYDSDSQGYSNDNGFLSFIYQRDGVKVYQGPTYWGSGEYRFTSDLSRLNIEAGGKIYVYARSGAPSGTRTSTYVGTRAARASGVVPSPASSPEPIQWSGPSHPDQAWYQNTYNRYAANAQEVYNTVTVKIRDLEGNTSRGYVYDPSDSQAAILGLIRVYRDYQRLMRDTRSEARRYGYTLATSTYETQEIHYY